MVRRCAFCSIPIGKSEFMRQAARPVVQGTWETGNCAPLRQDRKTLPLTMPKRRYPNNSVTTSAFSTPAEKGLDRGLQKCCGKLVAK
jgi:hypothetical protein